MRSSPITLPDLVRHKLLAQGEAGMAWISGLEAHIRELEQAWHFEAGTVLAGGSEALVMTGLNAGGEPVILKIGIPGSSEESRVFRMAAGRGYAALLREDAERSAMLLERLGPALEDLGLPVRAQLEIACDTLTTAWVAVEDPQGLTTGAEKAHWLAEFIEETWLETGMPCSESAKNRALAFAAERRRAHDPAHCVLVHGDPHEHNILLWRDADGEQGPKCKLVDPDGLFAEPAYDLGILMRGWNEELLAGDTLELGKARCALLSDRTGVDPAAIWQWGCVERVSTGLYLMHLGQMDEGLEHLEIAACWLECPNR